MRRIVFQYRIVVGHTCPTTIKNKNPNSQQTGEIMSSNDRLKCSFCGKTQDQVKKLIAGPDVFICDECVELCNEILDEEFFEQKEKTGKKLKRIQKMLKISLSLSLMK